MSEKFFDVAIIGAGPAGCAAALSLSQSPIKVALIDQFTLPIFKVCGQGIMPTGVESLRALGIDGLHERQFSHVINGIALNHKNISARCDFKEGLGLGIYRPYLSEKLFEKVKEKKNIFVFERTKFFSFDEKNNFLKLKKNNSQINLKINLLIGADGLRSGVRKKFCDEQKKILKKNFSRYALGAHVFSKPFSNYVEIFFSNGIEAYLTPSGNNLVNIIFMWRKDKKISLGPEKLFFQCLDQFPKLKKIFYGKKFFVLPRGIGPFFVLPKKISNGKNILLLGDAAGYVDPLSGEGINLSLCSGIFLGKTYREMFLDDQRKFFRFYEKHHSEIFGRHLRTTKLLMSLSLYPWLLKRSLNILHYCPQLFQKILSLNMGQPLWSFEKQKPKESLKESF